MIAQVISSKTIYDYEKGNLYAGSVARYADGRDFQRKRTTS
jgi:hypothetical protein